MAPSLGTSRVYGTFSGMKLKFSERLVGIFALESQLLTRAKVNDVKVIQICIKF